MSTDERPAFRRNFGHRISNDLCEAIGAGLQSGFLKTERGFFVHPASDLRRLACHYVFNGKNSLHPCWELYVQLAEAVRWRQTAAALGLDLRIEDRLMDITLSQYVATPESEGVRRVARDLVVYVEIKVNRHEAKTLCDRVTQYGRVGVNLNDSARGNDALKKARYLIRHRPKIFCVRAIEFSADFEVIYDQATRFTFRPIPETLNGAVHRATAAPTAVRVEFIHERLPFDPIDTLSLLGGAAARYP